jgi:RNA polymerase sigma-70 factor, ECF subfamily
MVATEDLSRELADERGGLLGHCYRMLGSWDEAEDAVQETSLRAWRGRPSFRGSSSVRTWLYRIATNVCLTALDGRGRRALPSGLGAPSDDPAAPPEPAGWGSWIQPIPTDPAAVVGVREDVRLALIAGLQHLPPKQRAVLLLREVLVFSAAEVAEMLDTTVPAVKSALQRARATLEQVTPETLAEPTAARDKELLAQYMTAFEEADLAVLERALRADATIEVLPSRTWFAGKRTCLAFLAPVPGAPGDWRMVPTSANGQPAVLAYRDGEPYGVAVLTTAADGIAGITVFGDAGLIERWRSP